MNGVYNRKLFTNKSQEARNKLRDMGGVAPMAPQMGGIMASSPELMQAAMRRPVVMPATNQPMMAPASPPAPQMLPPSQPIPNISGIPQGSSPKAPAPRPMAQKPGVAKFNEGGMPKIQTDQISKYMENPLAIPFGKAFEFGSTAITTENPEKLGLPEGARAGIKKARDELKDRPEASAQEFIAETIPEKDRTGDTKSDLRKAAAVVGIQRVPAEAKIDQLNKAIFGAKLAGAIAGNYVNPNTGQELRPTAGSRIAQAAVEGLAVERETTQRRAQQEAALAVARSKAAGGSTKPGKGWFDTAEGKYFTKLVQAALPLVGASNLGAAYDRVAQEHPELVARARIEISGMGGAPDVDRPNTSATPPPEGDVATDTRSGKVVGGSPYGIDQTASNAAGDQLVWTGTEWQAM